ncbi:ABC transporter substrate-binding protein [Rhizohabitans arisaemae]|uniref:ABC transporter substrate-binding protein n=1 Tax=Rhizohabitans arisaemae TaxID=2720610 RepID=UPI0024B2537C|nr:ABC transporter substrate-binding protein [Rhizohabitans arisaemae]
MWWGAALTAVVLVLPACGGGGGGGGGDSTSTKTDSGAWGATLKRAGEPVKGGTLTVDVLSGAKGISPLYFNEQPSNNTIQIMMQVFDQLVTLEPGSLDPKPGLAETWEVSKDGLTYSFQLREAQFSNGSPVTAADVKFSLESVGDSLFANLFSAVKSIETPSERAVVLKLSHPSPGLIYNLAFPGASIMPKAVVKDMGEEAYNKAPVGSGPFVVSSWTREQRVELTRNDKHWRTGMPYLDKVVLNVVPDDNTRVLNVRSGTSDVADSVPFSQIDSLDSSGDVDVLLGPGADMFTVSLNNSKPPLNDPQVRRALALATPVDEIIGVVFKGKAPAMNTVLPKLKYWTDAAKRVPYDLEAAKAALAKSSAPNGFSTVIRYSAEDQASGQTAQILQESFKKIGVTVKIEPQDSATFSEFTRGNYEIRIQQPGQSTSDVPIDDQFTTLYFNSPAIDNLFTFFKDDTLADLTHKAVRTVDEQQRADLFKQIHIRSMELLPRIPIAYTPNRAAVSAKVGDFNYLLNGWWRLDRVWKTK